jgi:hypothetical protein
VRHVRHQGSKAGDLNAVDDTHIPPALRRHLRAHCFDNLFAYPERVAALFEAEPRLGLVLPPTPHIARENLGLGEAVRNKKAKAQAEARSIRVPLDVGVPLVPFARMYWFRPAALQPDDEMSDYLIVPAVQQNGYYAKCVLVPEQFANAYVKAEFRLQKMIGRAEQRKRGEARLPAQVLKHYFHDEIARMSPRGARLARAALRRVHRWVKR